MAGARAARPVLLRMHSRVSAVESVAGAPALDPQRVGDDAELPHLIRTRPNKRVVPVLEDDLLHGQQEPHKVRVVER